MYETAKPSIFMKIARFFIKNELPCLHSFDSEKNENGCSSRRA